MMFTLWGKRCDGEWLPLVSGTSRECGRALSGWIAEGGWELAVAMKGHKPGE